MRCLFLDCETSGLVPGRHQVLSVGFVVFDGAYMIKSVEFRMKLQDWADVDPDAMRINGIDLEEHDKGALDLMSFVNVVRDFVWRHASYGMVYGHNVQFDLNFLKDVFDRLGWTFPFVIGGDTYVVARALREAGLIPSDASLTLGNLARLFGLNWSGKAHSALVDARMTAQVYFKLLGLIKRGLE